MKRIGLEHKTFGDLLVVAYVGMDRAYKHSLYLTKCVKCGRERICRNDGLLRGRCACPACRKPAKPVKAPVKSPSQKKTKIAEKATKAELREKFLRSAPTVDRARFKYTHLRSRAWRNSIIPPQEPGASKLPFYQRWKGMMNRCYNDSHTNFPAYGGRGVFVEKTWHDAYAYNAWAIEHGLSEPGRTVDRIDVNGPYGPDNCRVIPKSENKPERSRRKFYGMKLKTLRLMAQLNCGEDAPSETTIAGRLERGEDILSAIEPVRGPKYSPPKAQTIEQQIRRRLAKAKKRVKLPAYKELGVYVCEAWHGREGADRFVKWAISMGFRPELTLDRINNYGPYSPNNCRWVDRSTQNLNKRRTRPDFTKVAQTSSDQRSPRRPAPKNGVKNPIAPF